MSERIHALAQLVLGKTSLEECSIEELQHLVKRYPYFAPAQFLLLQKLKAAGSTDDEEQQRKAILYFHDPLQFEDLLSADRFYFDEPVIAEYTPGNFAESARTDEPEASETTEAVEPFLPRQNFTEASETNAEEPIAVTDEQPATAPEPSGEPSFFFAEQTDIEQGTTAAPDASDVLDESFSIPVGIAPATPQEPQVSVTTETAGEGLQETTTVTETPGEEIEPTSDEATDENLLQELVHEENPVTEENSGEPDQTRTGEYLSGDAVGTATLGSTVENEANNSGEPKPAATGVASAPTQPAENAGLAFEPYHTVDYFASQGIKISVEELPKDKLAKQVRSFTEWLKVMKRLPAAEMARVPQSPAERSVETMASHSVEESNVFTEAMAEVWVKQGNREKAIETYNKLSLLNPSKKAYFAAKIENLKGK